MAIEALKEPERKIIDGNKLILALSDWWYSSFGLEETEESKAIHKVLDEIERYVEHEKSVGGWIPCSERLPENIGRYIVTLKDIWAITVKVAVYGVMPQDTHNKKVFWLYDSCHDDLDITEDVVAWMPLPEPYRKEQNNADAPR